MVNCHSYKTISNSFEEILNPTKVPKSIKFTPKFRKSTNHKKPQLLNKKKSDNKFKNNRYTEESDLTNQPEGSHIIKKVKTIRQSP